MLINPFYPKDPHASFGKHVLTPTLALTSIAAATPDPWKVEYWDENLLHGRPPFNPLPQVVGITVHLTFANRAYELAAWYRNRGCVVILGGLHVMSCPDEARPHADILAIGDGVQLWPGILRDIDKGIQVKEYRADYTTEYRDDPEPTRRRVPSLSERFSRFQKCLISNLSTSQINCFRCSRIDCSRVRDLSTKPI